MLPQNHITTIKIPQWTQNVLIILALEIVLFLHFVHQYNLCKRIFITKFRTKKQYTAAD